MRPPANRFQGQVRLLIHSARSQRRLLLQLSLARAHRAAFFLAIFPAAAVACCRREECTCSLGGAARLAASVYFSPLSLYSFLSLSLLFRYRSSLSSREACPLRESSRAWERERVVFSDVTSNNNVRRVKGEKGEREPEPGALGVRSCACSFRERQLLHIDEALLHSVVSNEVEAVGTWFDPRTRTSSSSGL